MSEKRGKEGNKKFNALFIFRVYFFGVYINSEPLTCLFRIISELIGLVFSPCLPVKMIAFVALSALLTVASAQYPYQQGYQQPQPQQYQPQPQQYQPQQYQPQPQQYQPQPQQYQPQPQPYQPQAQQHQPQQQPQPARTHNPAAVHYVNIGAELAGDYKFGYDTGKGNDGQSFREETRLPDGTVQGAYGYVDETGKQRVIKYTAGKNGFQVEGDGIPKAPAAPAPAQAAPANPGYNAYNGNQNYQGRGY